MNMFLCVHLHFSAVKITQQLFNHLSVLFMLTWYVLLAEGYNMYFVLTFNVALYSQWCMYIVRSLVRFHE